MKRGALLAILIIGLFASYGFISDSITVDQQETNDAKLVTGSENISEIKESKNQAFTNTQNMSQENKWYQIDSHLISVGFNKIAFGGIVLSLIVTLLSLIVINKRTK